MDRKFDVTIAKSDFVRFKSLFGLDAFIFPSVWLLMFFAVQSKLFRNPGSFSHIVIGELIIDTGHLIYHDSFSFTRFAEPRLAQQWLGECVMAVIRRLAGLDRLLTATLSLITLLLSRQALRIVRSGMNPVMGRSSSL